MSELATLQQEIADETAASDIECYLDGEKCSGRYHGWWYNSDRPLEGVDPDGIAKSIKYLELRGRLLAIQSAPSSFGPFTRNAHE